METITRSVQDWVNFFEELKEIKAKYGSTLINESIIYLKNILSGKLGTLTNNEVINLLVSMKIVDINDAISLLESLKSIVNIESLQEKIREAESKYGIDDICFIKDALGKPKVLETQSNANHLERIYLPKNTFVDSSVDLTLNNVRRQAIYQDKEFIVDRRDLTDRRSNVNRRVLYTSDFRFRVWGLPLKEEMSIVSIENMRFKLFEEILLFVKMLPVENREFKEEDPNQEYSYLSNIDEYYTYNSDGALSIKPKELVMDKVLVSNANFVVIAKINEGKVTGVKVIVNPIFYQNFRAYLDTVPDVLLNLEDLLSNWENFKR